MKAPSWLTTGSDRLVIRRFAGTQSHEQLEKPLRIVQLTDQHFGPATPHELQLKAIQHANALRPDLVVLTGDYVAHSLAHLDEAEDIISRVQAPTIATLGNHDHWTDPEEVTRMLQRANAEVLTNAWTTITLQGQKLQVVGVDDAFTNHADSMKATKDLDPSLPTLGLSHVGEEADVLWQRHVPLVLSGHTHSGQVAVGSAYKLTMGYLAGHRYVHGLYGHRSGEHEGAVYINAGIGSSRVGLRLGERARPEIALFLLGVPPGSRDEFDQEKAPLHHRSFSEKTRTRRYEKALQKQKKHKP